MDIDTVTDTYLRRYADGLVSFDPASWRHYLPPLITSTARRLGDGSDVIVQLLNGLLPPDRDPPRLASLSPEQQTVVTAVLEALAFGDPSLYRAPACRLLEERWIPDVLHRQARASWGASCKPLLCRPGERERAIRGRPPRIRCRARHRRRRTGHAVGSC